MKAFMAAIAICIGLCLASCTKDYDCSDQISTVEHNVMNYSFHLQEQITNLEKRIWRNEKVIKAHMEGRREVKK